MNSFVRTRGVSDNAYSYRHGAQQQSVSAKMISYSDLVLS